MKTCTWGHDEDTDEDCDHLVEGATDYCGKHNRLFRKENERLRKALEKKTSLLSKARIKKVSNKLKSKLSEYSSLSSKYLAEHKDCEIKLLGCEGQSIEIHHCAGRGENLNNVSTWKSTCRHCHTQLHDKLSAKEAREKGLKV